jgi:hypothetical protein
MHIENPKNYRILNSFYFHYNAFDIKQIIAYNRKQQEIIERELRTTRKELDEMHNHIMDIVSKKAEEGDTSCLQFISEMNKLIKYYNRRSRNEDIAEENKEKKRQKENSDNNKQHDESIQ